MTAWTEPEKYRLRTYLGFGALFRQLNPALENAIKSVQAIADGGVMPDDSTQAGMRDTLSRLDCLETQINSLYSTMEIIKVDGFNKIEMDVPRAVAMLKQEGRRLIRKLSIPLSTSPVSDYFSPASPDQEVLGAQSGYPYFGRGNVA